LKIKEIPNGKQSGFGDRITLGDLLAQLAEREQYQRKMRRANEVMERLEREDPQARQDYLSELRGFEGGTARDGLSDTTAERHEYIEDPII
jgi:hypothetical protein